MEPTELQIKVFGELEKVSETISKARCRIFYKGLNRNSTFITDEFAELLLSTLPYTPVKGIYDNYEQDYTDHGSSRSLGRIYGIVPENPNIAYELHQDEDGVERNYACCDVYLFTGLYDEAYDVVSKAQSMELYEPSIKGKWSVINGNKCYVFEKACFLGLQVLGEEVEPCFEGAAFYTLTSSLKEMVDKIEQAIYSLERKEEKKLMDFKLSDERKNCVLWRLLNEDGNLSYSICAVYDDYCVVYNINTDTYERVKYTKNDDTNSVELGDRIPCYIIDVTESEMNALNTIRPINGETFEKIDEVYTDMKNQNEKLSTDFNDKCSEYTTLVADNAALSEKYTALENDKTELEANYTQATSTISTLEEENNSLKEFKANVERQEKEQILDKYSQKLSEDVIDKYRDTLDNYSAFSLEKELAFELVGANPEIFSLEGKIGFIPKDEPKTGIEALLDKYKN